MKEGGDKVFGTIVLKYSQVHIIKFNYLLFINYQHLNIR